MKRDFELTQAKNDKDDEIKLASELTLFQFLFFLSVITHLRNQ